MASKAEIKEHLGYDYLDVQGFVYEVFAYSAVKFGVARSCIPKWEGGDIPYEHRRIIPVISRIIFKYQITQRKSWSCEFNTFYLLDRFQSWNFTKNLLMETLRVSMKSVGCIRHKALVKFYEWYMSTAWEKFYKSGRLLQPSEITGALLEEYLKPAGLWKEFEEDGGYSKIYNELIRPEFDSVDVFYHQFIPEFCIPYHNVDKLPRLSYTFYDKSVEFFRKITKNLSRTDRRNYNIAFNTAIWHDCRTWPWIELARSYVGYLSPHVFLSELYEIPPTEIWKLKPENARPLLPRFDRWLQEHGVNMNLGGLLSRQEHTSRQETASYRRSPGQEKRRKTESSSLSTVEDFGQLNLGPSYLTPWNVKPENIGFRIGSNLDIDASRQQKARHRRRLSQEARRNTKSSSYSGAQDFSQFKLGPLETKSCLSKNVNIGLGIQSPEESLLDVDASVVGAATSSENRPGTRSQEVERDRKGSISPEEREMRKSSSLLRLEEGFSQFNLGPSVTKSCSPKPANIGLGIQSSEEDVDTIRQKEPLYRRRSSQGPRRRTKSSSHSGVKDLSQFKSGPLETKSCSPKPVNIDLGIQSSEEDVDTIRRKEPIHLRRLSQEPRRKTKSSSHSGVKDISQSDLGLLETKSCSPKPVNIGLGIQSPEESLQDVDVSVVDSATSSQNSSGARPQEEAINRRGSISPEEGEIRKSSSLLSLAESFAQLNLDSSETDSSGEKKK